MSDVSGIPNLGFGGGNFFAPQFSYNPQMSAGAASAAYAPAANYAQNVTNNLFSSGGGFGRQTDYYSGLGAQYSAAGMSPYGVFGEGGGSASPYQTSPSVFDTGASPFQGGGGSSGMGGSIYNSGGGGFSGGSYGNYGGDSFGGGRQDPYPNMSMPGGLNSSFSSPSGASPIDWGGLFGGSARADPAPGMAMPGGLGSPMSTPQTQQQQPSINWGNVGAAADSSAPYTSGIAPDLSGGQAFAGAAPADPFPGMAMPGGLDRPMTAPEPGANFGERFDALGGNAPAEPRTYDFKPMFEGGGGGGFGTGGTESQTFGGNAGSFGGNPFSYIQSGEAPVQAQDTSSGDKPASTIAEEARARLADIIGSPETAKAVEKAGEIQSPANDYSKFQQPGKAPLSDLSNLPPEFPEFTKLYPEYRGGAPASAEPATDRLGRPLRPEENPPRPPADIFPAARLAPNGQEPELFVVHHTGGRSDPASIVADWQANRPGIGTQYIMDRNGVVHDTLAEYGYSGTSQAKDIGVPGSGVSKADTGNRNIVGMEIVANDARDVTPAQQAALVQFANERYPNTPFYGHGEISTNKEPDEGVSGAQAVLASRPAPFNFDWSNAPIPGPENARPEPAPTSSYGPLATQDAPFVNDGTPFGPPVPADYKPPAAAPVKHSGLELARANIDTPIERIAMERGGQKAVDQVSSMAIGQTPRQLAQSYGGLFMSKAEPLFGSLGITRSDFEKAISMPQTKQDLKMRFMGGDEGIDSPQYQGVPVDPNVMPPLTAEGMSSNGLWSPQGVRQSENIDDRRMERSIPVGEYPDSRNSYTPAEFAEARALGRTPVARELDSDRYITQLENEPNRPFVDASVEASRAMLAKQTANPADLAPFGPSNSAFDLSPGGFGEGGYGNAFQPPPNMQQGPTMPPWQSSIPPAYRNPEVVAALQGVADRFGIPAEAAPAVLGLETSGTWNPLTHDKNNPNYGVAQLNQDDFRTGHGTLGGMTFDEYLRAPLARQIAAYSDYIASSPHAGYLKGVTDPALAASLLQAIQFSPQADKWAEAMLIGDTGVPTASNPDKQAKEVRPTTIDAMRDAFARRISGFPHTDVLPGGR